MPRRFEKKREWLAKYKEYLVKIAKDAYNSYCKKPKQSLSLEESIQLFNCTDYIPSYITLSDEEIKFVYNLWLYYFSYENMSKDIMRVVTGIKIA